ncbi:hypothetical protein BJX70DRAFT_74248 [Aspergillus crustosus]
MVDGVLVVNSVSPVPTHESCGSFRKYPCGKCRYALESSVMSLYSFEWRYGLVSSIVSADRVQGRHAVVVSSVVNDVGVDIATANANLDFTSGDGNRTPKEGSRIDLADAVADAVTSVSEHISSLIYDADQITYNLTIYLNLGYGIHDTETASRDPYPYHSTTSKNYERYPGRIKCGPRQPRDRRDPLTLLHSPLSYRCYTACGRLNQQTRTMATIAYQTTLVRYLASNNGSVLESTAGPSASAGRRQGRSQPRLGEGLSTMGAKHC